MSGGDRDKRDRAGALLVYLDVLSSVVGGWHRAK